MTSLQEYAKWDRILKEELSDSSDEDPDTKILNRIKQKAASLPKKQTSTNNANFNKNSNKLDIKDILQKSKERAKNKKKKNNENKKKKKHIKIIYDPLNIPQHSLRGIFINNFCPTSRLLINAIYPGITCCNLIHYYYTLSLSIFILFYILNIFLLFRLSYFYDESNCIVLIYYFHLIRVIFHSIIDIPLCLFQCKIKDSNNHKLKKWRLSYNVYTLFILILCSMLFYLLSPQGPKLNFTEYRHIMFFMKDDNAWNKINQFMENNGNLSDGIIYVIWLMFVIDICSVPLFIFKAASFKRFERDKIMLYFIRYCSGLMRVFIVEIIFAIFIWIIKTENDPNFVDILHGIGNVHRSALILPILTILYLIITWINNKIQAWLSTFSFFSKKEKKKKK